MTTQERVRRCLILEEMRRHKETATRLGILDKSFQINVSEKS